MACSSRRLPRFWPSIMAFFSSYHNGSGLRRQARIRAACAGKKTPPLSGPGGSCRDPDRRRRMMTRLPYGFFVTIRRTDLAAAAAPRLPGNLGRGFPRPRFPAENLLLRRADHPMDPRTDPAVETLPAPVASAHGPTCGGLPIRSVSSGGFRNFASAFGLPLPLRLSPRGRSGRNGPVPRRRLSVPGGSCPRSAPPHTG